MSDNYENDTKAGERKCRGNIVGSPEVVIHSREQILPKNMKAYLSNPKNKENLNDQRVVEITNNSAHDVNSLLYTQEEADTRLLLHFNGFKTRYGARIAIVWSPDTDMLVLCVAVQEEIDIDIWFKTGIKRDSRYIPVHRITEKFGSNLCSLLLPFHTLLDCDSTRAFRERGRQKGFQLLRSSAEKYMEIGLLGDSLQLDDKVIDCCE